MRYKSPTYTNLLETLHNLMSQAINNPVYSNSINDSKFERSKIANATSIRIPQPIVIADLNVYAGCSMYERYILTVITEELKEYNCLWQCSSTIKKSNAGRQAIKGLIVKTILIKTETTNIYVVNPLYLRRGDLFTVLTTTANMLSDESKIGIEHIINKKPVKEFNIPTPNILLLRQ